MAGVKAICTHVPGWEVWGHLMSSGEHMDTKNNPLIPDGVSPTSVSSSNDSDQTFIIEDPAVTVMMEEREPNPKSKPHSSEANDQIL